MAANGRADGAPRPITAELARWAAALRYADLPANIRAEAVRAFVNWMGCALGGSQEPAVAQAAAMAGRLGGGQASIIGRTQRTDVASAAFVNCIASSVHAYDDAHLVTVIHPSGPASASAFAVSEAHPVSGEAFLTALVVGLEMQCRLANMLLLAPARFNLGFYVNGLTGPIGAAMGVGSMLGLDAERMRWAIGIAASQASGFRATHGTMTAHFRPGHATRAGVWAALLAADGFTAPDDSLEAEKGFVDVFSPDADLHRAVDRLDGHFELLGNGYKPYPCGIVIHPTLDACLDIQARMSPGAAITRIALRVHPLALSMTGVRTPREPLESHISLYHWASVALLRGRAGLAETQMECIEDPAVVALRAQVEAVGDATLDKRAALAEVTLTDGQVLRAHVTDPRGSGTRPMTDAELDAKFREQATMVLAPAKAENVLALCRGLAGLKDVGREIAAVLRD